MFEFWDPLGDCFAEICISGGWCYGDLYIREMVLWRFGYQGDGVIVTGNKTGTQIGYQGTMFGEKAKKMG